MSQSKKSGSLSHNGFEWAGTVARIRRSGGSSRAGRRSALLGMLTASYANSTRNSGANTSRTSSNNSSDRG